MTIELTMPIKVEEVRKLKVGDVVHLSGTMITGRDAVHKWIADTFIHPLAPASPEDLAVFLAIKPILDGGIIYHCGPVVSGLETQQYRFVAAGPTTSMREEPYQGDIMRLFSVRGVIGKGGMGEKTLRACQEVPSVYFHAVGGAAALIAQSIQQALAVYKLEFGVPEAIWVIQVEKFPVVVTMDSHGNSLHAVVKQKSKEILTKFIG